ncbi:MAG: hypothetical protein E7589_01215 [Ruminococcaceae bacterium]|nr:hypothetical protein [Oscillospiraceae bacterium]
MRVGVFLRFAAGCLMLSGILILLCSSAACEDAPSPTEYIYSALVACEAEIDVAEYALDRAAAVEILRDLLCNSPELFYVSGKISYSYGSDGRLLTLTPAYKVAGKELDAQRKFYTDTVVKMLSEADTLQGEAELALYIHDAIASKFEYDTDHKNYDAYSLFRDGRGVCQAYSLGFIALCHEAGLEAKTVISDAMDHAWNAVKIDGEWYHIDVTRADPISDESPSKAVLHKAFLRSDAAMASLGYHGYNTDISCKSTRFEKDGRGILEDISEAVIFRQNGAFAARGTSVVRVDLATPHLIPLPFGDIDGDGAADARDIAILLVGDSDSLLPFTMTDTDKLGALILEDILKKYTSDGSISGAVGGG